MGARGLHRERGDQKSLIIDMHTRAHIRSTIKKYGPLQGGFALNEFSAKPPTVTTSSNRFNQSSHSNSRRPNQVKSDHGRSERKPA